MDLSLVPFNNSTKTVNEVEDGNIFRPKPNSQKSSIIVKYGDCMRNHAASIGGHANDGCGEFISSVDDSLTCAACGCHRNFHRKQVSGDTGEYQHHYFLNSPPMLLYNVGSNNKNLHRWEAKCMIRSNGRYYGERECEYDRRSETPEGEEMKVGSIGKGKRSRTKFSQEQKDRMLEFAEKTGWRMQRNDDVALNKFCTEIGVRRNVLKVWMHNNKNAHRRRESGFGAESLCKVAPPSPSLNAVSPQRAGAGA